MRAAVAVNIGQEGLDRRLLYPALCKGLEERPSYVLLGGLPVKQSLLVNLLWRLLLLQGRRGACRQDFSQFGVSCFAFINIPAVN